MFHLKSTFVVHKKENVSELGQKQRRGWWESCLGQRQETVGTKPNINILFLMSQKIYLLIFPRSLPQSLVQFSPHIGLKIRIFDNI